MKPIKLCINCKHCMVKNGDVRWAKCTRIPSGRQFIDGKPDEYGDYYYCTIQRAPWWGDCGKRAKYFEEK